MTADSMQWMEVPCQGNTSGSGADLGSAPCCNDTVFWQLKYDTSTIRLLSWAFRGVKGR